MYEYLFIFQLHPRALYWQIGGWVVDKTDKTYSPGRL